MAKVFRKQEFAKDEEIDLDFHFGSKHTVAWEYPYAEFRKFWKYQDPKQLGHHSPCFQMFACLKEPVVLDAGTRRRISLGVKLGERCWPENHGGLLSIDIADAEKFGLTIAPTHVPANFMGEMSVVVFNHGDMAVTIEPRQSIAQLMFIPLSPLGQCEIVRFAPSNSDDVLEIPERELFFGSVRMMFCL